MEWKIEEAGLGFQNWIFPRMLDLDLTDARNAANRRYYKSVFLL